MDISTTIQIDPELLSDDQHMPELVLIAAVIEQAVKDLDRKTYRRQAQAFFASDQLEVFCEWLGWDAEKIRCATAEGMALRNCEYR
jgi:hypothetical protein